MCCLCTPSVCAVCVHIVCSVCSCVVPCTCSVHTRVCMCACACTVDSQLNSGMCFVCVNGVPLCVCVLVCVLMFGTK